MSLFHTEIWLTVERQVCGLGFLFPGGFLEVWGCLVGLLLWVGLVFLTSENKGILPFLLMVKKVIG